jgi:predicted AAA+ superfamily ATPase
MWIERDAERTLARLARQFKVVLVTGLRQSGKTSLLTRQYPNARFVTLDDPAEAAQAQLNPGQFLVRLGAPAIIDEVQYAPSLFRHMKLTADRSERKGQYFLTGSQSFPLMQGVSESLAGRAGILDLATLSADEIQAADPRMALESYVLKGGFPALHAGGPERPDTWFPSYVSTYLERDIRNVLNVTSLRDYARFLRVVAARTAATVSYADMARDIGVSPNTVKAWLSVLQASGLVFLLEPYFRSVGKRLVKSPKLYLMDTGLACHLLGIRTVEEWERSPLAGSLWETYAFGQLYRALARAGDMRPAIWYWRTADGREVDFVVARGGRYELYEAKMAEKVTESDLGGARSFARDYGPANVISTTVICRARKSFPLGKGVLASNGIGLMAGPSRKPAPHAY